MDRSMNEKQKELVGRLYRSYTEIILMASAWLRGLQDVGINPYDTAEQNALLCRSYGNYMKVLHDNSPSSDDMLALWNELVDAFKAEEA